MRTRYYVSFHTGKRPWSVVSALFDKAGCDELAQAGESFLHHYGIELFEDGPRLEKLRAILKENDIEWSERRDLIWSHAELVAAPLLYLCVAKVNHGDGGPRDGTQFDWSIGCPRCGSGAVQTSDLFLKRSEVPKQGAIFRTVAGQTVVSPTVAHSLSQAGLQGFKLREVRSARDGAPLPWLQIIIESNLPPLHASTSGVIRDEACPRCNRNGYFHTNKEPFQMRYSSSTVKVEDAPDVLHTWEWFGYSSLSDPITDSRFTAAPILVVKPEVYLLFKNLKVQAVRFEPVELV